MWCRKTRKPQTFLIKCPWSSLPQSEKLHFPFSVLVCVIDLAGWAPLWEPPLMVGIISRFVWAMENKWPSEEESWQTKSSYEFIWLTIIAKQWATRYIVQTEKQKGGRKPIRGTYKVSQQVWDTLRNVCERSELRLQKNCIMLQKIAFSAFFGNC